jgi:hypothetical protein
MTRSLINSTLAAATVAAMLAVLAAPKARAGIADSPLPILTAGKTTFHLYSVPGVIAAFAGLGTYFACTSTDTATIRVGVELFSAQGGTPANDAAATSLSVAAGATVIFATNGAAGILADSSLSGGSFSKGSARVLATSRKLACTAFVADANNLPPATSWHLNVIKKNTQTGV